MNNICEIEVKPASGYSGREPYVNGQMDGRTDGRTDDMHHTIIRPTFIGRIKRAVRIITCSKYNSHTEPLLKVLNLLKIEDIMKIKALKLHNNELPKYFDSMFTESNDNHSHDTRHKSLLYQLPTKTSTGRLYTRKLDTHSFSVFSNYIKNIAIFRIIKQIV